MSYVISEARMCRDRGVCVCVCVYVCVCVVRADGIALGVISLH